MGREGELIEVWASCPDGRGLYEVSDRGRVRSWNNNRWGRRSEPKLLKLRVTPDGYTSVNLGRGVVKLVHGLVCEAFHGPRPAGFEAAHGNGHPSDNRASNLRWATPIQNSHDQHLHGRRRVGAEKPGARLTDEAVIEIRRMRQAGVPNQDIAREFNIAPSTCSGAALGRKWAHIQGVRHGA